MAKFGPMCFVCGSRDSNPGQKFHTAQHCPVRVAERASKGKGKGAAAVAQVASIGGDMGSTKLSTESTSQLFQ